MFGYRPESDIAKAIKLIDDNKAILERTKSKAKVVIKGAAKDQCVQPKKAPKVTASLSSNAKPTPMQGLNQEK